MNKNLLITFKFSQHYTVFSEFHLKLITIDMSHSIEFLSSKMSEYLKRSFIVKMLKLMQESLLFDSI